MTTETKDEEKWDLERLRDHLVIGSYIRVRYSVGKAQQETFGVLARKIGPYNQPGGQGFDYMKLGLSINRATDEGGRRIVVAPLDQVFVELNPGAVIRGEVEGRPIDTFTGAEDSWSLQVEG